jgi:hypothetical protein
VILTSQEIGEFASFQHRLQIGHIFAVSFETG